MTGRDHRPAELRDTEMLALMIFAAIAAALLLDAAIYVFGSPDL
jgi:hypothetical protein